MVIHGSAETERRTLTLVGSVVVLCVLLAGALIMANPFGRRAADLISVAIDTPYVGEGVGPGTQVVAHGVPVGEVTAIASLPSGGVRLNVDLQKTPVTGLADAMEIEFRPINYFGVTGVNLQAGSGGRALRDGMQINTVPRGNFTLQALLSRLGEVSTGVLTPKLIGVIDRATRYTDALDPLVETMFIAANSVAEVQTVSAEQLLVNTAGVSVAFPSTAAALIAAGDHFLNDNANIQHRTHADYTDEEWEHLFIPTLELASGGLFADIGKLESSHISHLLPIVDTVKALTDVVPPLIRPEGFAQMLAELRSRFEQLYGGTPDQRAMRVRVVLDQLPGVAGPLGAMGMP